MVAQAVVESSWHVSLSLCNLFMFLVCDSLNDLFLLSMLSATFYIPDLASPFQWQFFPLTSVRVTLHIVTTEFSALPHKVILLALQTCLNEQVWSVLSLSRIIRNYFAEKLPISSSPL